MKRKWKVTSAVAAAMAITLGVAACSGADSPAPEDGGDASIETVDISVGYIPIGVYSYFWRAQDAGYFEEENLNVELTPMAGGGEIIPALQSGSLQFGISDALGVLNARNQGIDVKYVSFNFAESAESFAHSVVTADKSVQSPKDLEGKTVATNLSYNTDWTMMREWLRQNDVDIDKVTFQELPFPDMLGAVRNGTVAAAGMAEPFVTVAESEGLTVLGDFFVEVKSPVTYSGVLATEAYIADNEDVVERFVSAINRAIEDFNDDPQIARDTIKDHTEIEPGLVDSMGLGQWTTESGLDDIEFWISAAEAEGILDNAVAAEDLLWTR